MPRSRPILTSSALLFASSALLPAARASVLPPPSPASSAPYVLSKAYAGASLLSGFVHRGLTGDPTNGFVRYIDRAEALADGLVRLEGNNSVYIGVDHTNLAPAGRRSIRLMSEQHFTQGLMIADVRHMPASVCGTWPALWMEPKPGRWPYDGEIDIIEGVNKQLTRSSVLHIGPQHCEMDPIPAELKLPSNVGRLDCYTHYKDEIDYIGCPVNAHSPATFGDGFNAAGGAVEAMLWDDSGVRLWTFPRNAPMPASVLSNSPDPSEFGTPLAQWTFERSGCDFGKVARELHIVVNTDVCGTMTEGGWTGGCAQETGMSCAAWAEKNPAAFKESFWLIDGIKWFVKAGAK